MGWCVMDANWEQESMLTILAMVNADKDGQIESKMMKARQMEEIREARVKALDALSGIIKEPFDWRAEKAWIYEGMEDL